MSSPANRTVPRLALPQVQLTLTLTDPAWQQARIRFIQGQQAVQPRP